jgi:hypothetical protein
MIVTLKGILENYPPVFDPDRSELPKLLKHLGKPLADDAPLRLAVVLEANGFNFAVWCLNCVVDHDRDIRSFAVWCGNRAKHLMAEQKSVLALESAEKYLAGQITRTSLNRAFDEVRLLVGQLPTLQAEEAARAAMWVSDWKTPAWKALLECSLAAAKSISWEKAGNEPGWQESQLSFFVEERARQCAEFKRLLDETEQSTVPPLACTQAMPGSC